MSEERSTEEASVADHEEPWNRRIRLFFEAVGVLSTTLLTLATAAAGAIVLILSSSQRAPHLSPTLVLLSGGMSVLSLILGALALAAIPLALVPVRGNRPPADTDDFWGFFKFQLICVMLQLTTFIVCVVLTLFLAKAAFLDGSSLHVSTTVPAPTSTVMPTTSP